MGRKRGDLTSTQIIMIVMAAIGFLAVLGFIVMTREGLIGYSQEEVCHISVLTRATAPTIAQSKVPLKCTTRKVCITDDDKKKTCEMYFAGEEDVEYVEIPSGASDAKRAEAAMMIEKTNAEELYKCWDMMGQGKLKAFPNDWLTERYNWGDVNPTCLVCARVAIDNGVENLEKILLRVNVREYMRTHEVSPGISYLKALGVDSYPVVADEAAQDEKIKTIVKENVEITNIKEGELSFEMSNTQKAIIFSQATAPSAKGVLDSFTNLGSDVVTGLGTSFLVAPSTTLSALSGIYRGGKIVVAVLGANAAIALAAIAVAGGAAYTGYKSYANQQIVAGYCGGFTTGAEEERKEGCTLVSSVPYSGQILNKVCPIVEGTP